MTRFVRITFQECESIEGQGSAYKPLGLEQDVRLKDGYIDIGDAYGPHQQNIVDGKLHKIGETPRLHRAQ